MQNPVIAKRLDQKLFQNHNAEKFSSRKKVLNLNFQQKTVLNKGKI
jgi:hypothetical protein